MATKSTHKRWSQPQLTKIFIHAANLTLGVSSLRYRIWMNPTDHASLRLSLEGYKFVIQNLKLRVYEYELDQPLSNKNLLQLERYFQGMYYLLQGKKFILFDEQEATMMALYGNDLKKYLCTLEAAEI